LLFSPRRALSRVTGVSRLAGASTRWSQLQGFVHPGDPFCVDSVLSDSEQPILS
jgi:hypothetical protein